MITLSGAQCSVNIKVGGLDSRDQSRSRSRTSLASRPVFKTCRDFLDARDQLLEVSRSRVSIETMSRQIETPKPSKYLFSADDTITPTVVFSNRFVNF